MQPTTSNSVPTFLVGGGEMGTLTGNFDWQTTSLGSPDTWPLSLRTTLGLVLHSAFPMFLFWGPELICFYNDAYRPSLGNNGKHPAVGKKAQDIWPEVWDFIGPLIEQVMTTGKPVWFEDQLIPIHRNGHLEDVYWTFSYSPAYGDDGQINGTLVTCTETTQKVLTLRQLNTSEERFRTTVEQAPVAMALFSGPAFVVTLANKLVLERWGRTREQVINKPLAEALPQAGDLGIAEPLMKVYTRGEPVVAKEQLVTLERNGRLENTYVDFAYEPYYEVDGRISGVLVVCNESTEQVLARRKAEESEASARRLTDTVPAIIWTTDPDGNCSYLNRRWYEYTGQTEAEAEGFGWLDVTHPDDKEQAGKRFLEANEKQIPFDLLYRLRRGNGDYHWAIDKGSPRFGPDGHYLGMIGTVIDVHDQKLAEEALRASEAKLRSIVATAPVAIGLFVGRDLIIENPNQTFIDIVGKGPDIAGRPLREVMPELITGNQPFLQILDDVFTSGKMFQSFGSQVDIVRNGVMTHTIYNITYTPVFDAEGQVYAIVDIAVDVTEEVKARQAVEASEQQLRSVVDSAPFPIGVYVGREMRIHLANQSILDVWGKGNEVIGKLYAEILPELENQAIFAQLDRVYTTGIPFHAKNQRVDLVVDGKLQPYYFNYSFTPLVDAEGQVYGVMNTAAEITDLMVAKHQVEEAETALRGAVELAELATWSLNIATGQFRYSPRFMDWLGFADATRDMDDAYNPLPDEYRRSVADAIAAAIQPGSLGFYENEHPIINRLTGQVRIIHAQAQVTYDAAGQPLTLSGTAQDVTEQRRLRQELERQVQERTEELATANEELMATNEDLLESNALLLRSNENLQRFAYVASHDLQEPLRKIQQFGDLLLSRYADELGEARTYLERMRSAASRMSTLIKDLLTFSSISTQRDTSAQLQLSALVQAVISDLDMRIQETGAVIEIDPLPVVEGDPLQLGQLFQNLLSNALKFRRPGVDPLIRVSARQIAATDLPPTAHPTRAVKQYHLIEVSDNGIGFDEKYTDRIFQVFQRLHGRSEFAGTGIGLAICQKVVANHGGAITATSQPGQGATFSVYLPA